VCRVAGIGWAGGQLVSGVRCSQDPFGRIVAAGRARRVTGSGASPRMRAGRRRGRLVVRGRESVVVVRQVITSVSAQPSPTECYIDNSPIRRPRGGRSGGGPGPRRGRPTKARAGEHRQLLGRSAPLNGSGAPRRPTAGMGRCCPGDCGRARAARRGHARIGPTTSPVCAYPRGTR